MEYKPASDFDSGSWNSECCDLASALCLTVNELKAPYLVLSNHTTVLQLKYYICHMLQLNERVGNGVGDIVCSQCIQSCKNIDFIVQQLDILIITKSSCTVRMYAMYAFE